jgi:hypothetical protein
MEILQEKKKVTITLTNEEADSLEFITERFLQNYDVQDENEELATEINEELSGYTSEWIEIE